jgi:hypothetical protein
MKKLSHDHRTTATESKSAGLTEPVMVDDLLIQLIRKQLLRSLQVASGQVSAFER